MEIDLQQFATGLLTLISGVLGWFARELWQAVQALRKDLSSLETKIGTDYVRYDRLQDALKPIMEALSHINNKLDHKVDK